jgi:hypothetical protein
MSAASLKLLAAVGLGLSLTIGSTALAGQTTLTGSGGQSLTTQTTRQRTGNSLQFQRSTTYPSGKTANTTGNLTGDGQGGYSGTATHTNRQGIANPYEIEGQFSHSNGTYQHQGTRTGPNGRQVMVNGSGTYGNGQFSGDRTVAFPNGQTRSTQFSGQRTGPGAASGSLQVTGRNGQVRSGTFQHSR